MASPISLLNQSLKKVDHLPGTRLLKVCALGVMAGLAVVAFHDTVIWIENHAVHACASMSHGRFALFSFLFVVGGSLLATVLIRFISPEAAGGGVMPVKLAFWKNFGHIQARTAIAKFVGSAITLGTGVSIGPEGPAIQIGAGTMSGFAGTLGVAKQERREFCAGGAAAGLAAIFNAPLGSLAFVLEEIIGDLNSRFLVTVALGAIMGAQVARVLIGEQPAFQVHLLTETTWVGLVVSPLVAVLAAAGGGLFQRGSMRLRGSSKNWRLPRIVVPAVGAIGTWVFGTIVFFSTGHLGVFGVGYQDVTAALAISLTWQVSAMLLVGKLAATMLAVGTENCGGIFAPNFFVGAVTGSTLAALLAHVLPLSSGDQQMLVMVGMCACLGAVIRTPLACILLIVEVTGYQFSVLPALLIATLVSQGISHLMADHDMYEARLIQDGIDPHHVLPPRHFKRWREMPASALASFKPVTLTSLKPDAIRDLLKQAPYLRFPVAPDGRVTGMVLRRELELALEQNRPPRLEPALWIDPKLSVADAQKQLIASSVDMVCVGEEDANHLLGVLTLHDLLRGQRSMMEDAPA